MAENQGAPRITVFVSYSRRDKEVADRIAEALERDAQGNIKVLIDRWNLPYGEPWWDMLVDFIQRCDRVLFLVSPDSIGSRWCRKELAEIKRAGRRIVPVLVRDTRSADMPDDLRAIQALPFIGDIVFEMQITQLVTSLYQDVAWSRQRRVVDTLAEHWQENGQPPTLLFGADQVSRFIKWTNERPPVEPPLSETSARYLDFSRFYSQREEHFTTYRRLREAARGAWMNWVYLAGAYVILVGGLCVAMAELVTETTLLLAGWTASLLGGLVSAVPAVRFIRRHNAGLKGAVTDTEETLKYYRALKEANAFIERKVAEEVKQEEFESLREFKRKTEREAKARQKAPSNAPTSTERSSTPAIQIPQPSPPPAPTTPPAHIPSVNDPLP